MEHQPKKWYATWKFAVLVILIVLLLVWLLQEGSYLDGESGLNF